MAESGDFYFWEREMSENYPEYKYSEQDLLDACTNPPNGIIVSFGGVISDFRKRNGMKQAKFAETLSISRGQLAAIENNHYPKLTLATIDRLAREMKVDRISLIRLWYETRDT